MLKIEVTETMIAEALDIGTKTGLFAENPRREDVSTLIHSVLSLAANQDLNLFNCEIALIHGKEKSGPVSLAQLPISVAISASKLKTGGNLFFTETKFILARNRSSSGEATRC